jgi:transcriptional regulator with XRE-family HTH domain
MVPGSRLRQIREQLGLTYRDVERVSYDLASEHARPEFIVRISRLADIENRGVTPSLYKLYALAAIYHLDPLEVCRWYEVPLERHFFDGTHVQAPKTHLAAAPAALRLPLRFDPAFDPRRTDFLSRMVETWGELEGAIFNGHPRYRYGYIGLEDRMMEPLLRPGSLVLVDPTLQQVRNSGWNNEYERPLYFLDLRDGYRCSWCLREGPKLMLQPHPLSPCAPEVRLYPDEVEVVGQVVGVAMRLGPR